jgi:hypothetical protein
MNVAAKLRYGTRRREECRLWAYSLVLERLRKWHPIGTQLGSTKLREPNEQAYRTDFV